MSSADVVDAPAERDERREAVLARFTTELGDAIVGSHIRPGAGSAQGGDLWIRVVREAWPTVAEVARGRLGCGFFDFLSGIDWMPSPFGRELDAEVDAPAGGPAGDAAPASIETGYAGGDTRFQVFARVLNLDEAWGVTFKADLPDDDLSVGTWSGTYLGANWHEREAREMFGFVFVGHPGLTHLYLPSEFEGHPLRKDFPLLSRRVKPWPGIVDVEPMPGEDEAPGSESEGGEG